MASRSLSSMGALAPIFSSLAGEAYTPLSRRHGIGAGGVLRDAQSHLWFPLVGARGPEWPRASSTATRNTGHWQGVVHSASPTPSRLYYVPRSIPLRPL